MENFGLFDIIILAIIFFLGLKGVLKGFFKEIFSLIGIVGGLFVASRVATDLANASVIVFAITFVGFWALSIFAGITLSKTASFTGLGIFDKILGYSFASLKIFCILAVIFYSLNNVRFIQAKLQPKIGKSFIYQSLIGAGSVIMKFEVANTYHKLDGNTSTAIKEINQSANVAKKIREISK